MIGEMEPDSASVIEYFNKIASLSDGSFSEEKPLSQPTHSLTIEGNNMMQKVQITGYFIDDENFIIESNQNPGAFFNSKTSAEKVFVSVMELIQTE